MKNLIFVFAFALISISVSAQEKANINKSRSNIKDNSAFADNGKGDPIEINLSGKNLNRGSIERIVKNELKKKGIEEDGKELVDYIMDLYESSSKPGSDNVLIQKIGININFKWTDKKGREREINININFP